MKDFISILKHKFPESEKSQENLMLDEREENEQSEHPSFSLIRKRLEEDEKVSKAIDLENFELREG